MNLSFILSFSFTQFNNSIFGKSIIKVCSGFIFDITFNILLNDLLNNNIFSLSLLILKILIDGKLIKPNFKGSRFIFKLNSSFNCNWPLTLPLINHSSKHESISNVIL